MIKILVAASLACLASFGISSGASADYRHMDHSTQHHHPHSGARHHDRNHR